jgi:hypothetical protein
MSAHRDRLAAQAAEDRAQQQLRDTRPNLPPDRPRAPHPWDVTPEEPCATGHQQHDYTMKGPDGLRRCWYCCRLSPRSRTELAQRTQPAGTTG